MKLLHVVLIVSLVQLCATSHSNCAHRRQDWRRSKGSEYDEHQDDSGYQDEEESFEIDPSGAVSRSRILIVKGSHEWRYFKSAFGKNYSSNIEEEKRVANYLATKDWVERHNNSPKERFKLAINHFADRSKEELQRMNGYISPNISHMARNRQSNLFLTSFLQKPAPKSWDWRQYDGVLAQVKAQGECGSCWAFTTAALLEGQQRKVGMKITDLSAQHLLDCEVKMSQGCKGGFIHAALEYVVAAGGIERWDTYPYEGERLSCRQKPNKFIMKGGPWVSLEGISENDLEKVVAHYGPVAIAIKARQDLYFWGYGVYDKCEVGETVDHAVLLVGYGKDEGGPYWIYKNSWGDTWGEGGYGMIKKGVNMCGINEQRIIVRLGNR